MDDLKRFIKYLRIVDGCWEWQGALDKDGYGFFTLGKLEHAHRSSYKLFGGVLSPEMEIDHLCRNRSCVNPDHLEQVTSRVNTLRSPIAPAAINARKTHCINGHEFTAENIYWYKKRGRPERTCRECTRINKRQMRAKLRQARLDAGEAITMGPKPKTHCKRGHEKSGSNLHIGPTGIRYCRACNRLKTARYRAK